MVKAFQHSYRALALLNSLLVCVFILFFIDFVKSAFLSNLPFVIILIITGLLKSYFMSGIGACVLEILTGEELVLKVRRFHQNAKKYWLGFFIVFALVRLIDFSFFVFFPSLRGWGQLSLSFFETAAVFALAQWLLHQHYLKPLNISRRRFKTGSGFLMVMGAACALEFILATWAGHVPNGDIQWGHLIALIANYIHTFEFIFCSICLIDVYPEIIEHFSRQEEIFMIRPVVAGVLNSLIFWLARGYPPFFVVLKALSPKKYTFREFDQVIWQDRYYKGHALVCITCFTSNSYEAYTMAKEFKKRGSKVVMGGPHVTYLPDEALAFCDSVVIGQAEGVWRDVVRDYEKGELKARYSGTPSEADFEEVHKELLNSPPSIIKEFLETARGCKFRCHFCTIPALNGGQMHLHPIKAFVELIEKIKPRYKSLAFIDNNIYSDPGYAKELFTALKPLKIKWHSECTLDIAQNQETLRLAKASGCAGLGIGYEIFGGSAEKKQGGKFAMARKYFSYSKTIKKMGIGIKGQFIFGFDSDNLSTLFELWKSCFLIFPRITTVSFLTPLPGSGLYAEMLAKDRIINLNWRSYNCHGFIINHPQINPAVLSFFVPFIQVFFLMTTCSLGVLFLGFYIILSVVLSSPLLHQAFGKLF